MKMIVLPLSMLPLPYVLDSSANGPVAITAIGADRLDLSGTDNYGAPAQGFASLIAQMDDRQFVNEAAGVVYQSARTQNSAYADWHWQARACYYEARRRGNIDLYQQAFDQARWSAGL